jgi:prenyltransferase/squalene oxidase-like repeat protein
MSWELASFLILGAVLLAGFAWYERSRPPAQVVALVAALAALAIAGRIAFAAFPNVKPTTDIVVFSGYALGGAPGFAVGALTAVVSNFWFGQGPWTPWQMAGWGLTGILGGAVAVASGQRIGRFPLALICAFTGFAYGALLDFSLMVTYGGEQSLGRFLALSARGLPFNIAHAAGNAALALVAGPAMIRMLLRYRHRFEFAWSRDAAAPSARAGGIAAGAACVIGALLIAIPVLAGGERAKASGDGSAAAVSWLRGTQNGDGGFGFARRQASSPAMTGWAVLGLEAAGVNPLDVDRGDATPITYLAGTAGEISTTGDIERTILLLRGAGLDPRRFQRHDLVRRLLARRGGDGSWAQQVNPTAFGILALSAAGSTAGNARSAAWLRDNQNQDGGWGFAAKAASDPDSSGAALQALAASGSRAGTSRGVDYLREVQRSGGGFALAGGQVNAQSTAWAAQGLAAAGLSPASVRSGGRSALDYLASSQATDGHYRYSSATDQTPVWVTGQALLALNDRPFPLAPVPRAVSNAAGATGSSAATSGSAKAPTGTASAKAGGTAKATATPPAPSGPADPIPFAPVSSTRDGGGGGPAGWLVVVLVAAVIAGSIWVGWVLYRRRLP